MNPLTKAALNRHDDYNDTERGTNYAIIVFAVAVLTAMIAWGLK